MSQPEPNINPPRYNLLCRALQAHPDPSDPLLGVQEQLDALDEFIHRELLLLARQASPDDFAEIYLGFSRELMRFREFVAWPHLAQKTVVAFGGGFSAGKSSLINALMGSALMVVEVDPTTALPAYVLAGEQDAVYALNTHRLRISLSDEEFASLTHDEIQLHGSEVSRALSAAFVVRRNFLWQNLAFIDTPGYSGQAKSGGRTDESIAAAQLDSAHAIVWVVNIKQGVLPESDIAFLARLDPKLPKMVVVSHIDQVPEDDRQAIVERVKTTLEQRNLPVVGVFAFSARHKDSTELIKAQLEQWNQNAQPQTFSRRFKALFVRYQRGLDHELKQVHWRRHRIKQLSLLAEGDALKLAQELGSAVDERSQLLDQVGDKLAVLRQRFFAELKQVGDKVGIALPEPSEIDLLEAGRSNLLEQLIAQRQQSGKAEPDMRQSLALLRKGGKAQNRAALLQSLPEHAVADQEEHLRCHYALLLAALLGAQDQVSEGQSQLLLLLLGSLKFDDLRAALFEEARTLTNTTLVEAARVLREADLAGHLLLDALILLRLDAPLSEETTHMIGELSNFLAIDLAQVQQYAQYASHALGLGESSEFLNQLWLEIWPQYLPLTLTTAALRKGLNGGVWQVKKNLTIKSSWQAEDAVIIFDPGVSLSTSIAHGTATLTNCRLIQPRLHFSGLEDVTLQNCFLQGDYQEPCTAIECAHTNLIVEQCTAQTRGALTLSVYCAELKVSHSQFTYCGSADIKAGAITTNSSHAIEDCGFIDCIGNYAGAIHVQNLNSVKNCEFVNCKSTNVDGVTNLALFTEDEAQGDPAVDQCIFRSCSLSIGSAFCGDGTGFAINSQFLGGNLYFHSQSSTSTIQCGCKFKNGQELEMQWN